MNVKTRSTVSLNAAWIALVCACFVGRSADGSSLEGAATTSSRESRVLSNGWVRVIIGQTTTQGRSGFFVDGVEMSTGKAWRQIVWGTAGAEFSTSLGSTDATSCEVSRNPAGEWVLRLSGKQERWSADGVITLLADRPVIRREQTYRFKSKCRGAIHPGWRVPADSRLRYTFPLRAYDKPFSEVPPLRADVSWALPLPFHVWHGNGWVAAYGIDRGRSKGTIDYVSPDASGFASLRSYYPDTTIQKSDMAAQAQSTPLAPQDAEFEAGETLTMTEILAAKPLAGGEEPLLEAERVAADILLSKPRPEANLPVVADGITDFYKRCQLWEPDALGKGRGWFLNMWVYTQAGQAQRKGPGGGYFDLGWGEGIAAETFVALTRNWNRTRRGDLLVYVDEMTRNMDLFKRGPRADDPYFDRSDGKRFFDFTGGRRIWTHSLGHTGSQLIQAYVDTPDYPRPEVRRQWFQAAQSIAAYFAKHQRADGDLCDIFDDNDREVSTKRHRIAARIVVSGLWTRLAGVIGDKSYVDRALRLAKAAAPEVLRYAFYNQMLDTLGSPIEFSDGEAAYYVLEGVVPLYEATQDPLVLTLCKKAAAFGISWTYFFDLPKAHNGITRGGQACRMPDFPLIYPIGPAKAVEPLVRLSKATGDPFYARMAQEMVTFIASYQFRCPGKPWDGGMIHALEQSTGKHWGPDKCGQVDTGMATGNSLAAIEYWMRCR